jgi:hypothetical protein
MADVEFTRKDIEDLARKLSTLQPFLSDQERQLLLAIFATAADHAESTGPGGASLPAASIRGQEADAGAADQVTAEGLQQQLLSAYVPGNDFDSLTQAHSWHVQHKITAVGVPPPPGPSAPAPESSGTPQPKGKK